MRIATLLTVGAALTLASVAPRADAHHSTAIYDSENPLELAGTVVEWQFVNPHVFIVLEVVDAATGEKMVWNVEGSNTAGLFRRGWTPNTLKAGDEIKVTVRPLRSGAAGGNYSNPRWADGTPIEPRPSAATR
jgi:hypothetical protein